MSYTREQFHAEVITEATALKEYATLQEIERLNFDMLSPSEYDNCIYGQMTGYCFSRRASELISTCCVRYFHQGESIFTNISKEGWNGILNRVNGPSVSNLHDARHRCKYFSAIEAYILLPDAKNAKLIAFLKGESEILVL